MSSGPPSGKLPARTSIDSKRPQVTSNDLVIHSDHGMGRLVGLKTLDAGSATDTIEIEYQDGHLLVPVSEIGLLFRYGAGGDLQLDRLRTKSWGTKRRAAIRKIDEAARQLIGLAASRAQSTT